MQFSGFVSKNYKSMHINECKKMIRICRGLFSTHIADIDTERHKENTNVSFQ